MIREWHRRNGYTTILVHPNSDFGRTARPGWKRVGKTWVGIANHTTHPGLDVYDDTSLLGRWRRFWGTGKDELRQRALRQREDRP